MIDATSIDFVEVGILATIGAIVGSFLSTLVIRWGHGESVMAGRSKCDGCGMTLPPWQMVPVLSYLSLRGRCATCRAPIDLRHPAMEILCAALGAVAALLQPGLGGYAGAVFFWQLTALALFDADHFRLPDKLVGVLAGTGLTAAAFEVEPSLADRLLGLVIGAGLLAAVKALYRLRTERDGLGLGDVKLCGAIGAWLGPTEIPWVIFFAAVGGMVWAMTSSRTLFPARRHKIPFGVCLAISGVLLTMTASTR